MARNPVRDERQGDLFGAPPPPAKLARRISSPPKPKREEPPEPALTSPGKLGATPTRPEIDELLEELPDQELAYLVVEATRLVKRRLVRQGRGPRPKGDRKGKSPLDDALRRIGGELMEFEDPGETW
jgi:hypothetical protein